MVIVCHNDILLIKITAMHGDFIKMCLTHGGLIHSLEVPNNGNDVIGLCNPSVLVEDGVVKLIVRNVNYVLWASSNERHMASLYGPLYYITPDNDNHLRTTNYIGTINTNGSVEYKLIDTSKFDWEPQWEFVGHEDMRLVRWDGKLYGTGVQRDWNPTGVGRMHLSELDEVTGAEVSRVRVSDPENPDSYCEKNWMPIADMPYHYVKWYNPLKIVKVDPVTGDSELVLVKEYEQGTEYLTNPNLTTNGGTRGSSQVVRWGDYRIAITHLCHLELNEKGEKTNAYYYEQFVVWDLDWNIVRITEPFKFAGFNVEFTNGLAYSDGTFYIPFSLQDNTAFMLTVGEDIVRDFVFDGVYGYGDYSLNGNTLLEFFDNPNDSYRLVSMAEYYHRLGYLAASCVCYERACDCNTFKYMEDLYSAVYMAGLCISKLGSRDEMEKFLWFKLINMCPERSEGYLMLSRYYMWRGFRTEAYAFAKTAYERNNFNYIGEFSDIYNSNDAFIAYVKSKYWTDKYGECEDDIKTYMKLHKLNIHQSSELWSILKFIENNKNNARVIL